MGDHSSHFRNASSVGVGRIFVLQYFTISNLPAVVVAGVGGGGGVERGETTPGGRTNCNVGGTAAAKTSVNCSGRSELQCLLYHVPHLSNAYVLPPDLKKSLRLVCMYPCPVISGPEAYSPLIQGCFLMLVQDGFLKLRPAWNCLKTSSGSCGGVYSIPYP